MFLIFQVLFYLKLERTKSLKHKQDKIVNEQNYTAGLKEMLHWGIYIMFTLIKI